ncbi:hypothetical protein D3C81_806810 [compost metagenome]
MNCAEITTATSTYSAISAGRRSNSGMLLAEPLFWLGRAGSSRANTSDTSNATPPMAMKVTRQPSHSPTMRPSGIPSTIATEVPVANRPSACGRLPSGAMRTASDAVIDQNTACASAMPMRLAISTG